MKAKRISRIIASILLLGCLFTGMAVSAATPSTTKAVSSASSTWWEQAKPVYSKATGKVIGYISVTYTKTMSGGRPQFDSVSFGLSFTNYYRGSFTVVEATGDVIVIDVSYQQFIDSGIYRVQFTP